MLLHTIAMDIVNGTLLTQEDDETLEMVLLNIYDDMSAFMSLGVIIGKT
jgi:RIO-like serine/threonine protein kinase